MSTDEQRKNAYVADLVARVSQRTRRSKEVAAAGKPVLVNPSVLGKFHATTKEMAYPLVAQSAAGSRFVDLDGNEYVDLLMGFGVGLLGHNPPMVLGAIREHLERGLLLGLRDDVAGEVAAAIAKLTGSERVFFCNSGTEAVMGSVRIARAVTGRAKVAIFAGSYHGHSDTTLTAPAGPEGDSVPVWPGVSPNTAKDTLVLEYGAEKALEVVASRSKELAAVLVEPVQARRAGHQPREFLHALRAATKRAGVVLIFDEMVTGFRLGPGGAQSWYDVRADLAAYGKIVGGGMPIGIVAGAADYMNAADGGAWTFGDPSCPFVMPTFVSGTFCKHPLSMTAARAVTAHLLDSRDCLHNQLNQRSDRLVARLNELLAAVNATVRLASCGSIVSFCRNGSTEPAPGAAGSPLDLLHYELLDRGVYWPRGPAHFVSTAHADEDMELIVDALRGSLDTMCAAGITP